MKNYRFADYIRIFTPSYSRHFRRITEKFGIVLILEIIMIIVVALLREFADIRATLGFSMFSSYLPIVVLLQDRERGSGLFVSGERKTVLFRTFPDRKAVMKKALICKELNRFFTVFLWFFAGELFYFAENGEFRIKNLLFDMMTFYILYSIIVFAKRSGNPAVISAVIICSVIYVIFVFSFQTLNMITADLSPVSSLSPVIVFIVTVTGLGLSLVLNRIYYKKICCDGKEEEK